MFLVLNDDHKDVHYPNLFMQPYPLYDIKQGVLKWVFSFAKVLPGPYLPDIFLPWDLSNEVLHEVLSQGASEIQVVKFLAITVYLIK